MPEEKEVSKQGGEVVKVEVLRVQIGDKAESKVVKVRRFPKEVPLATARVSIGLTFSPEPYASVRVDLAVERPCVDHPVAIKRATDKATALILSKMDDVAKEAYKAWQKAK